MGAGLSEAEIASAVQTARTLNVVLDVSWVPFGIALFAFLVWGAARLSSIAVTGDNAILVATYASLVDVVMHLWRVAQAVTLGAEHFDSLAALSLGPARWLATDAPAAAAVLATQLDAFLIWKIVVVVLGVGAIRQEASRGRLATMALLLWLGVTLPPLMRSLASG